MAGDQPVAPGEGAILQNGGMAAQDLSQQALNPNDPHLRIALNDYRKLNCPGLQPMSLVGEGQQDITEGRADITQGLNDIQAGNTRKGEQEIQEGLQDIQEGQRDIAGGSKGHHHDHGGKLHRHNLHKHAGNGGEGPGDSDNDGDNPININNTWNNTWNGGPYLNPGFWAQSPGQMPYPGEPGGFGPIYGGQPIDPGFYANSFGNGQSIDPGFYANIPFNGDPGIYASVPFNGDPGIYANQPYSNLASAHPSYLVGPSYNDITNNGVTAGTSSAVAGANPWQQNGQSA